MASGLDLHPFARLGGALSRTQGLDPIPARSAPPDCPARERSRSKVAGTDARQRQARRELVRLHLLDIGLGRVAHDRDHVDAPRAKSARGRGLHVMDRRDAPVSQGDVHADAVTDWNAIMQATVAVPPTNPDLPDALGRDRAARRLRGGQRDRRGLRTVPRDHRRAGLGLAGRRGHRRRPSHPGDPAPGQRRGPRRLAGRVARGDPGRPGEGGRHRGRRGRRGRHAPAPGRRWLGCRRALHAGDRSRRLAADAARVRAGLPARLGPGDAVRPRGRARSSACRRRPRSTRASMRTTTTRSSSSAGSTAPSARKIAPMSRASTPPPPRCRCGTRPRARSAPRRARRSRRTRGSSPCWRWPWAMPPSRCGTPSTTTTSGGP